jgi:hypothetical protein
MKVKRSTQAVIGIAVLGLIGIAALAASPKSTVFTTNDGRLAIATQPPKSVTPNFRDPSLKTIAGNLSTYPYGTYFCCYGETVAEGGANFPFKYNVAVAFTPTADATVTRIEASVGAFPGVTSGFELSIRDDNSGVPGSVIKSYHIKTPPTYGDCCVVDAGNDSAGIPVKAGTQYWIAATTTTKDTEFLGGWAFNSTDMRETYTQAYQCTGSSTYCGSNSGKWVAVSNSLLEGFAVLGN